jgi:hypothetical protein
LAILAIDDRGRQAVQQGRRRVPEKQFIKVGSWLKSFAAERTPPSS